MRRSPGWIIGAALVAFLATTPVTWAVPPDDCEASGSIATCMEDLIDTQGELIEAAADMMDQAERMRLFTFGRERFGLALEGVDLQADLEERIQTLRNEHGRSEAVHGTITDDDYSEMIAPADHVKGKKCGFSDLPFFESLLGDPPPGLQPVTDPKFGDGNCNIFEATDVDGFPVKVNERKENMCERVCDEKSGQKGKSKERLVGRLGEGIAASGTATESLRLQTRRLVELQTLMESLPAPKEVVRQATACDSGYEVPGDLIAAEAINVVIVGLDVAVVAGKVITEILDTIKDVAEDACKQDVAGFNGSSGCIPLTIAVHIAQGVTDVIDGVKSGLGSTKDIILLAGELVRSFQADTLQLCTKEIKTDTDTLKGQITTLEGAVAANSTDLMTIKGYTDTLEGQLAGLQGDLGNTSAEVDAIKAELALVKSLLEATRDLLLTPQGRREGFPQP